MKPAFFVVLIAGFAAVQCGKSDNKTDVPSLRIIHENINYLDSILNSSKVDSISLLDIQLDNTLSSNRDMLQTPDDKAVYDSLARIKTMSVRFIRFCVDSRANLELLRQDINTVAEQYRSGKISNGIYINSLLESEQIQVDLINQFLSESQQVLDALKASQSLAQRLSSYTPVAAPPQ